MRKKLIPLIYIGPHLLLFLLFFVLPFIFGIFMSFTNYSHKTNFSFIGLSNFKNLFDFTNIYARQFWMAIRNTFIFIIFSVPLLIIIPLFFAHLLHNIKRCRVIFQSILYVPSLFSVTSALIVWTWMFNGESGIVNYFLSMFGASNIAWLTTQPWVWIAMIVATVWWTIGGNMIIFLAGMQEVSQELYEAAELDGAGSFRKFVTVTLPGLKNQMVYALLMTIIASANVFGQPHVMTGGGPGDSTKTISMLIREVGFTGTIPKAGQASAMSVVFGLMIILVSFTAMWLMNKQSKES